MSKPVVYVPLTTIDRAGVLAVVILPFLALAYVLWFGEISLLDFSLFLSLYVITGLWGICIGLHRYFTHASFKTSPAMEVTMALAAHFAVEGKVGQWVPNHLVHHTHSDTPQDIHSPYHYDGEELGFLSGFFHAHMGWFMRHRVANQPQHTPPRLLDNKRIQRIDSLMPLWIVLTFAVSPAIGGLVTGTWHGAWTALLWGSLLRIFFVHHITWSVNSICHIWGSKPFATSDQSRNNWIFGLLAFGEGWHENHHAFCRSARHGLLSGQPDLSAWVIERLEKLGLVWDVIRPSKAAIQEELAA
jgi:stearoyl-CoA desaturase (Delta-9 desaturase)